MDCEIPVDEKPILKALYVGWSWALTAPTKILAFNAFGNVIVKLTDGSCWRVCPEDLSVEKLADEESLLENVFASSDFQSDWEAIPWIEQAETKLGKLRDNQCYGFKIWPAISRDYSVENMAIKTLADWLAVSGDIAQQIKDSPEGMQIRLVTKNNSNS